MSKGLQQDRASSKRIFRKPKNFQKAQKMYAEVFNDKNDVAAMDKEFKPMYSRVTKKIITKTHA